MQSSPCMAYELWGVVVNGVWGYVLLRRASGGQSSVDVYTPSICSSVALLRIRSLYSIFTLQSSSLFMLPWLDEWLCVTDFEKTWNENIYDAAAAQFTIHVHSLRTWTWYNYCSSQMQLKQRGTNFLCRRECHSCVGHSSWTECLHTTFFQSG